MTKVSVVVPIYNICKYLAECLESILAQTLTDIEIICVDDGSNDGSSEIIDDFAKADSRVVAIHQNNSGYGRAVNVGIDNASGEYIGIVESDDSVLRNMFEVLYDIATANDLDLVKGQCYYCWDNVAYRVPYHIDKGELFNKVLSEKDKNLFFGFFMNTWSGIYKKSFLDEFSIRHNESEGASYQDNGFWMQTMYFARKAMWIPNFLYLYRQDNMLSSFHSKEKAEAMRNEYIWVEKELLNKGITENEIGYCRHYRLFRHRGTILRIDDKLKRDFIDKVVEDYFYYKSDLKDYGGIINWYERVMYNPGDYCDELIKSQDSILAKLYSSKQIWIFGASWRAERTLRILLNYGIYNTIKGFVVSGKVEKSRMGIFPIYNIYDNKVELEDSLVIIAAKKESKSHGEIQNMLYKFSNYDYVECEDLFSFLYNIF